MFNQTLFVSPGLVDAVSSSGAGLVASLYAVRFLDRTQLGAYAVFLSASLIVGLLAQRLIFLPAQIASLSTPREARTSMLASTLLPGCAVAALSAPIVFLGVLVLKSAVAWPALLALGGSAAVFAALSPVQDHVRSLLFLADRRRQAAAVGVAHLIVSAGALLTLHLFGAREPWAPFLALSLGSGGSILLGLKLARSPVAAPAPPETRSLVRSGLPLLPAALVQEAANLVVLMTMAYLTSVATLGAAEAARIVSRPLQTLSLGLSRSLAPRLMESGQKRSRLDALATARLYAVLLGSLGLIYLAIAGWSYPLSPLAAVLPLAYDKDGLVAAFLVVTLLSAVGQIPAGILLGADQGRSILLISVLAAATRIAAVMLLAGVLGAYALPAAVLAATVASSGLGWRAADALLKGPQAVASDSSVRGVI